MLNAIHLASRGLQLAPRASPRRSGRADGGLLTRREAEVLPLLAQGATNRQIAVALGIGVETVRTHARNIYRKLGVSSRSELVVRADRERCREPAGGRRPAPPPRSRRPPAPATRARRAPSLSRDAGLTTAVDV